MRPRNTAKEDAIRTIALQIIAEEGLENLSMQKLAKAAGISPRTIYIKYTNKEDLLIKLFVEEVLGAYEQAVLQNFSPGMSFADGVKCLWRNAFQYFKHNRHAFVLMQYGKSSPLLNKAYQEKNIQQGDYFAPVHQFLETQILRQTIPALPQDVYRALLFAPAFDLINKYFDYQSRPSQIITEAVYQAACEAVVKGLLL